MWRRQATEILIKRKGALGANNVLPNFVAGRMDALEGTFVWNYNVRGCLEEELEELYNGRLQGQEWDCKVRIGCTQRLRQQQKGLAKDGTRCSKNEADPTSAQPGLEKGRK